MGDERPRRVTVLYDLPAEGMRDEAVNQVASAVARLGHETDVLGITDDLDVLAERFHERPPDLVINLAEKLAGNPHLAPDVAAALELLQVPFTGPGPAALYLSCDRLLARRLLASHGVPALFMEGRVLETDVTVGILGNDPFDVLPLALGDSERIAPLVRATASALRLRDYALVVVRENGKGTAEVVGCMPNPSLAPSDELARAARRAGWRYEDMIRRIMDEAWARREGAGQASAGRETYE
ncbi:MAG: hypothetical protein HY698_16060 [Deltaproteobacteria bacterium]|nr:hypothetical protein [Deltaproteobacteria bacterium]